MLLYNAVANRRIYDEDTYLIRKPPSSACKYFQYAVHPDKSNCDAAFTLVTSSKHGIFSPLAHGLPMRQKDCARHATAMIFKA